MANKKSAKKYILITKRNNIRNSHYKSMLKTFVKKADNAIETKSPDAQSIVKEAQRLFDKVASKGIIHKNQAARKKSTLAKKLNAINA